MKKEKEIKIKETERVKYENIVKDDNLILREVSKELEYPLTKENKLIMKKMIDYVRRSQESQNVDEYRPAYGISAIQLGFPKKMFYIRIVDDLHDTKEEYALINPIIIKKSDDKVFLDGGEGCLSVVKDYKGYIYRPNQIIIQAIDYFSDREIEITARGLISIVIQHEYDHLLGVLFYDRINKLDPFFKIKNATKIKS